MKPWQPITDEEFSRYSTSNTANWMLANEICLTDIALNPGRH